jgi:hypothetical protein
MTEVILSSDNVSVLGGPAKVSVDVDFGPGGTRGSRIFVGYGNPNSSQTEIGQPLEQFDLYINLLANESEDVMDNEYLYVYQYVNVDGSLTWIELFKLIPNTYSFNTSPNKINFVNGSGTLYVPINKVVPQELVGSYLPSNFNFQYSIIGTSPVSSSFTVDESFQIINSIQNLAITVKAVEFVDEEWIPLSGQKVIHGLITVV